jgi:molybdate transport system ATP-binding protein
LKRLNLGEIPDFAIMLTVRLYREFLPPKARNWWPWMPRAKNSETAVNEASVEVARPTMGTTRITPFTPITARASITTGLSTKTAAAKTTGFILDLDFTLSAGITVLFGHSGAGKSLTLSMIAGLQSATQGCITLSDRVLWDSRKQINVPIAQRQVGMVFQQLALFEHLTVSQNVGYGLAKLPAAERKARVAAMLARWGIAALASRYPVGLSGGERQRVALARTLVTQPQILLLDEPFSALDGENKQLIMQDLKATITVNPLPVLLVTHDRDEAIQLAEHLIILQQGRILTQGSPLTVLGAPRTPTVAALAGIENIFWGKVKQINSLQGTMQIAIGELLLEVPDTGQHPRDTNVRVAISARDILLAREQLTATSARNLFTGQILALQAQAGQCLVTVDCGIVVQALVTGRAVQDLQLQLGETIWLAFKSHSCYLLAE